MESSSSGNLTDSRKERLARSGGYFRSGRTEWLEWWASTSDKPNCFISSVIRGRLPRDDEKIMGVLL